VLRVARVADATGRYYLAALVSELDADLGMERGGRWTGLGAAALGLCRQVDGDAFAAVLAGRHPSGRHQLRLREARVCAYDLTFAAPKSASVLFALGGPGTSAVVREAHDDAVEAAMAYVATRAAAVRRTTAHGRATAPVDGVVAASFTHGVSRALDPHLHSHVVVANLAHGPDGRWRSLDGRGLYAHARAAGALYDAVLRHGIATRLGLEWVPSSQRSWELSGMDPVVLGAFSGRRAEIIAHLGGRSGGTRPTRREKAVAWAATREPKAADVSRENVRGRWTSIARDAGLPTDLAVTPPARDAARAAARHAARAVHRPDLDEHRFSAAIFEAGPRGISRRDALGAWAAALPGGASGHELTRCVDVLADWGTGAGVGEPFHRPGPLVPASHVLHVLGPRPASAEALVVWRSAASSIGRYRARWGVDDPARALGAQTRAELSALPARRLADHLATSRALDDALMRLGRSRERDRARGLDVTRGVAPGA